MTDNRSSWGGLCAFPRRYRFMLCLVAWLLLSLVSSGADAFGVIDTGRYFPAVVQGHHGEQASACAGTLIPQLSEVNNPRINGTGGNKLAFCSITANQNNTRNCDDGLGGYKVCAITGQDIGGLSLTGSNAFPTNGSTTDLNCNNNGSAVLDQKAYRNVGSSGCQLVLTAQPGYQIASLNMSNGGTLVLGPGDHFFETLSLDSTVVKLQSKDQALTRIFVKNTPTLRNNPLINAGGKQNLVWVSYNDFNISDSARFVGYLYAGGTVIMGNQATLTGRITARTLVVKDNSVINKGDAVVPPPLPNCSDIFTDPPTEGAIMEPPAGMLEPPLTDLSCSSHKGVTTCSGHAGNSFAPGDHDFNNGSIGNDAEIVSSGVTARLYFNKLDLNNAKLNLTNPPENLFIYVKGDLSIKGQNQINGIVYVMGDVNMSGNASIDGALAAGGSIDMGGNGEVDFSQDAVDNADLGGLCQQGGGGGSQVDHFELDHSGQALTCNPEPITIRACANAACSSLITTTVSLTLAPATGWEGGNQLSLTGGSAVKQLRHTTAGAVTLGVSASNPVASTATLCRAGGGTLSAAACTLNFADSGFLFDVPDTYANRPQQVQLKAVRKDSASQKCVPGFAGVSKPVSFWSDYVSPSGNGFGSKVTVNGNAIATTQGAATASNLSFDAQGEATLTVNYPDAGKMQLNARHQGSGDSAGLVMTGGDQFISRPVGLCITAPQGVCVAGDISCPVFKKTGEAFPLNLGGVAWQSDNDTDLCRGNLATPNFALTGIALASQLVAPQPGVEAVVGTASYDHAIRTANNLNVVGQSVNEVGVFRMTATPPAGGYFGYTITPALSAPLGRFIPVDFNLVSGDIAPACGAFSYMGQPFLTQLHIEARNQHGQVTQNYRESFAKGDAYLSTANNRDGIALSARLRSLGPLPWVAGAADFSGPTEFARLSDSQPDGPYRELLFGLYMQDNDGGQTLIAAPDFNAQQAGTCSGSGCNAKQIDASPMEAYFGRVLAGTAQGVASAPLTVPLQLQYHEAGSWHRQWADQCTRLSLLDGGFQFTDSSQSFDAGSGELTLDENTKIRLGLGPVAPGAMTATVQDGIIALQLAAPDQTVRIPFRIDLSKQPESALQPGRRPFWLSDPQSLDGMAIFGIGRGNDRIIYRREVMP